MTAYDKTRMQFRRGTAAEFNAVNPVLSSGEPGYAVDTKVFKIGDGVTHWNNLAPVVAGSGGGGSEVNDLSTVVTWVNVPDEYITESSVIQHSGALEITESQIVDLQSYITQTFDAAVEWTANHTLVDGTRYLVNDLVYAGGRLYKANYENESMPVTNATYWTDVGPGYRLNIDGRDISNIPYPVTQVNNQTGDITLDTTDLADFGTAVSGLLPVKNILAGTNVSVSSVSGNYTINHNGDAAVVKTTVFNSTGSQIGKFKAVYINGGQGDLPTIALASANGEGTSSKTYAITSSAIDHMSSGTVVVMGALTSVNTDQFNPTAPTGNVNGTTLWLSTSGNLTTTKPTAPYHAVSMGTIVRTHQNAGVLEVKIQNGYEIEELHNVKVSGIAHTDVLVYNSGTSLWENNNKVVFSDTNGTVGATGVNNILIISQANYDNIVSPDPNTIYYIV